MLNCECHLKVINLDHLKTNLLVQEALLLQRDHATHLSVQILQLQNIPFVNDCNRQMTLKFICLRSL